MVRVVSWVAMRGVCQGRMVAHDMEMWVVGGGGRAVNGCAILSKLAATQCGQGEKTVRRL